MENKQGEVSRKKIYDYIVQYMQEHYYSPTVREISEATGIKSTSTIHAHLLTLDKQGKINLGHGLVRATTIPDMQDKEYKRGYSQAIDDFTERLKKEYENGIGIPQQEIDFAKAVVDRLVEEMKTTF